MEETGTIVSVKGQVVEVSFSGAHNRPSSHDILVIEDNPEIQLEAVMSSTPTSFYCLLLTPGVHLSRAMRVINTKKPLMIPVGDAVLGRAMDIFGKAHDGHGEIDRKEVQPIFKAVTSNLNTIKPPSDVLETGIKSIDFFSPIMKGGKVALIGGAGIGKTVILTELVNRLVVQQEKQENTVAVFAAVGERSREAHELYQILTKAKVLPYTSLILGQMGESPSVRFRTAFAGVTLAEHFRDEHHKDVLFFMDNIYRFAQAGHELSTLMNVIPSEDGYQPTLPTEMAALQERLVSTDKGTVTSFLALYVPSDDMTDYAVRSVFPFLDTMIVLSRDVFQSGRFPAIDVLTSTSAALNPLEIGFAHYSTYIQAKRVMEEAVTLDRMVSLIGESELSPENRLVYLRSQLIFAYISQDLFISEAETGHAASFVPLSETIQVIDDILEGKFDNVAPDDLRFIGSIENYKQKEEARASE